MSVTGGCESCVFVLNVCASVSLSRVHLQVHMCVHVMCACAWHCIHACVGIFIFFCLCACGASDARMCRQVDMNSPGVTRPSILCEMLLCVRIVHVVGRG